MGDGSLESRLEFKVFVDDNRHYQDDEWRSFHGAYSTYGQACSEARGIVDEWLGREYAQGMTANKLCQQYKDDGPDPFITPTPENSPHFSAWDYAEKRCGEICGESGGGKK